VLPAKRGRQTWCGRPTLVRKAMVRCRLGFRVETNDLSCVPCCPARKRTVLMPSRMDRRALVYIAAAVEEGRWEVGWLAFRVVFGNIRRPAPRH